MNSIWCLKFTANGPLRYFSRIKLMLAQGISINYHIAGFILSKYSFDIEKQILINGIWNSFTISVSGVELQIGEKKYSQ